MTACDLQRWRSAACPLHQEKVPLRGWIGVLVIGSGLILVAGA